VNLNSNNNFFSIKTLVYGILLASVFIIPILIIKFGIAYSLIYSLIPAVLIYLVVVMSNPYWGLVIIFIFNYFIMGITRYIPIQGGIAIDMLIITTILGVVIQTINGKIHWIRIKSPLILLSGIWLLYCILELLNPEAVSQIAWATTIRGVAGYFVLISVLTMLLFDRFKDLKWIIFAWGVFTLLAVIKAFMQKTFGFDYAETKWLNEGAWRQHIIFSGIRYFSFYTDAGNFGSGMGYSMVVFSIISFYVKQRNLKIFYMIVAVSAAAAMMISGTRGALAVPFAGYALFTILSKNFKMAFVTFVALLAVFLFLKFTYIGESNSFIRRMRTAVNLNDESLLTRLDNQKKLRVYLADKPFGAGIGLGGGKAREFLPNAYLSHIPTDSWFVMLWVETGIVGLILNIIILFYIIAYSSFMVMFRIEDRELRGYITALTCGVIGIIATSYGNEVLGQFPTAFLVYMSMAFMFKSKKLDAEIRRRRLINEYKEQA
jgi:hypothetical protein